MMEFPSRIQLEILEYIQSKGPCRYGDVVFDVIQLEASTGEALKELETHSIVRKHLNKWYLTTLGVDVVTACRKVKELIDLGIEARKSYLAMFPIADSS